MLIKGPTDFNIVITKKLDYVTELDPKTVDGIIESAYAETNDNT